MGAYRRPLPLNRLAHQTHPTGLPLRTLRIRGLVNLLLATVTAMPAGLVTLVVTNLELGDTTRHVGGSGQSDAHEPSGARALRQVPGNSDHFEYDPCTNTVDGWCPGRALTGA